MEMGSGLSFGSTLPLISSIADEAIQGKKSEPFLSDVFRSAVHPPEQSSGFNFQSFASPGRSGFGLHANVMMDMDATLPPIPSVSNFTIREGSSMAWLKNAFESVGLTVTVSRNHVRTTMPSAQQEQSLVGMGVSAGNGKVMYSCSPRSSARGF